MRAPGDPSPQAKPEPAAGGYYLRWQGRVTGPFDLATLEHEWRAGRIGRLHQVSRDAQAWQALGTHADLQPLLDAAMAEPSPAAETRAEPSPCAALPEPAGPARIRPALAAPGGAAALAGAPAAAAWPPESAVRPAGWGRRLTAAVLDLLLLALLAACGALLLRAAGLPLSGQTAAQKLICALILAYGGWLYSAVLESCAWQATLGKLMVGLRVEMADGGPVDFGVAAVRAFMKFCAALPALAGVLVAVRSPTRQALHDVVAQTCVVEALPGAGPEPGRDPVQTAEPHADPE